MKLNVSTRAAPATSSFCVFWIALKGTINAIVDGYLDVTEVFFFFGGTLVGGYIVTYLISKAMAYSGKYSIVFYNIGALILFAMSSMIAKTIIKA